MTSYRRMRRQARQIRRGGMQPMMFVSTDSSQFPMPAGVLLARFMWRYRSELAPVAVAVLLLATGWWLHARYPHDWRYVLTSSSLIAWLIIPFGEALRLAPIAERVYAATVIFAAGVWVAAANVIGPFTRPLPLTLAIGTVILAVPWWSHRRRRAKVRVERKLAAWPDIARAIGLIGSEVMSATVDVWGWRARFRLARGQTITDVTARIPAIESGLGTFRGAVRIYPTPDDLANRFELRVLDTDPHADAIPWPGPPIQSIMEPIELGPFEDAAPCRVLFLRRHALFADTTGSGKSGGLNVLMANLTACQNVIIWGIDLKKGMELGPWQECLDRLATTPDQAAALLRDAVAILQARAEYLAKNGRRTWEPSPQMPALIIVIDEYAELAEQAPDAMDYTDSIARLGRALAVTLAAATQRPTQKAMGQGAVRSQMDMRICFRVREPRDVDLVLGTGMLTAGWNAHKLNAPGKFLISAQEHDIPRRARAYLLTDEAVAYTAARHAQIPRQLDDISRAAIERAYTDSPRPGSINVEDVAEERTDANSILWSALSTAPPEGIPVSELITLTGMSRRWVFWRLKQLVDRGEAIQTVRGYWRAAS